MQKITEKKKLNFCRSALLYKKPKVSIKYFVHDSSFASKNAMCKNLSFSRLKLLVVWISYRGDFFPDTAPKMKFATKDFLSKCDQICRKLQYQYLSIFFAHLTNFLVPIDHFPNNLRNYPASKCYLKSAWMQYKVATGIKFPLLLNVSSMLSSLTSNSAVYCCGTKRR